jgi:toxin secretion/phage lysis holin
VVDFQKEVSRAFLFSSHSQREARMSEVAERLLQMWTYITSGSAPIEAILLATLIIVQMADVATGWLAAFVNGVVSSKASLKGVARKAIVLVVVATVISLIPLLIYLPIAPVAVIAPILSWFIGTELLSIIENLARAGVTNPVLDRLVKNFRETQIAQSNKGITTITAVAEVRQE